MKYIIIIALSLVAITGHGQKQGPYVVFKYTDSWYHAAKGIDTLSFQLADVSLPIGAKVYIDAYLLQVSYKKKVYKMHRYFGPAVFVFNPLRDVAATTGYTVKGDYDTISLRYDTVKVIAEVYTTRHRIPTGLMISDSTGIMHEDSAWSWRRPEWVATEKVLAWEVWRKDWVFETPFNAHPELLIGRQPVRKLVPVDRIKILAYNRKEELPNVLQSWRVEW